MGKIRVGVLCGGKSAEHEISLLSARNIIDAIDKNKYDVVVISIDKKGGWQLRNANEFLLNPSDPRRIQIQPTTELHSLVVKDDKPQLVSLAHTHEPVELDVIFPVLHGTYGEDGTVQGVLKLANIPFVGASVLGSAVGMDKEVMKRLLREAGISTAKWITLRTHSKTKQSFAAISQELGLPLFVKPANLGSSVGVHKVSNEPEFEKAIADAFLYDHKILVEEFIDGRELECAVIGNEHPVASLPGEVILGSHAFHSYEAKYYENGVFFKIPAEFPPETIQKIQAICIKAYETLYCEGLARVDLFIRKSGECVINEINTIPGFTRTSACPKLWEASGVPLQDLLDRLIDFAIKRHAKERSLKTTLG